MRLLFVCLGNICRSAAAEAVMRGLAPDWQIDSAGTGNWHVGEPPYGPMQEAARGRGLDMSAQRARQFTAQDFDRFDLIVAMDRSNRQNIEALRPAGHATPVRLMTDFAQSDAPRDVPDPYYTRDFDGVLALISECAKGLHEDPAR